MARCVSLSLFVIALVVIACAEERADSSMEFSDMKQSGEKVFCTKEYSPVCGSDMKTYGNKCEFENAKRIKQDLTYRVGACDEIGV